MFIRARESTEKYAAFDILVSRAAFEILSPLRFRSDFKRISDCPDVYTMSLHYLFTMLLLTRSSPLRGWLARPDGRREQKSSGRRRAIADRPYDMYTAFFTGFRFAGCFCAPFSRGLDLLTAHPCAPFLPVFVLRCCLQSAFPRGPRFAGCPCALFLPVSVLRALFTLSASAGFPIYGVPFASRFSRGFVL